VQELPPDRTQAARCRIDANGAQDLPDCGLRDRHAEFRQFAVDPAVSPQRILLRQPDDKAGDAPDCGRATRRALPALSYFFAASLRCQASNVAGVTGKTSVQRMRGISRASAPNHIRSTGS